MSIEIKKITAKIYIPKGCYEFNDSDNEEVEVIKEIRQLLGKPHLIVKRKNGERMCLHWNSLHGIYMPHSEDHSFHKAKI